MGRGGGLRFSVISPKNHLLVFLHILIFSEVFTNTKDHLYVSCFKYFKNKSQGIATIKSFCQCNIIGFDVLDSVARKTLNFD